jgi:hypothetical protein
MDEIVGYPRATNASAFSVSMLIDGEKVYLIEIYNAVLNGSF